MVHVSAMGCAWAGDQVHLLVVIAHQHRDVIAGMDTTVSVPILIEDEPKVEKQHVRLRPMQYRVYPYS